MLLRLSTRLPIVFATVVALYCSRRVVGEDRRPTNDDDCRPAARRFNDTLKTRDDQIVHSKKTLGESFDS